MIRDPDGNYWPEPADLEQGCPCCGAERVTQKESSYCGVPILHYWYQCKSHWTHDTRYSSPKMESVCPRIINARVRMAAMERAIKAADKLREKLCHQVWCSGEDFGCICDTVNIRTQYDAARKGIE